MNIETIKRLSRIPNFKLTPEQQAILDSERRKSSPAKNIVRHKTKTKKTNNLVQKHSTEIPKE